MSVDEHSFPWEHYLWWNTFKQSTVLKLNVEPMCLILNKECCLIYGVKCGIHYWCRDQDFIPNDCSLIFTF